MSATPTTFPMFHQMPRCGAWTSFGVFALAHMDGESRQFTKRRSPG